MFEHVLKIMRSCPCGREHRLLTEECVVSADAAEQMKEYLEKKGFSRPLIVADENTVRFADNLTALYEARSRLSTDTRTRRRFTPGSSASPLTKPARIS